MPESLARDYLAISGQPAEAAFHTTQISIGFGEEVDFASLRAAWEAISAVYPALRTTFAADGTPAPKEGSSFAWRDLDWQTALPTDPAAEWQRIVESDAAKPIASGEEPSCRFVAIRLPNGHGHALWSFHAALLDESAAARALFAWLAVYDSLRTGAGIPELRPDDATTAQSPADDVWKEAFADLVPPAPLTVLPLPSSEENRPARRSVSHTYERPERAEFARVAETNGVDLAAFFGAAWSFVVARATASDDALLLEPFASDVPAMSRTTSLVVRRHRVEASPSPATLARAFAEESRAPAPPASLEAVAAELGLAHLAPAAAYDFRPRTLNDELQLAMPRWMAADAKLFHKSAAPVTLRVTASDRPTIALDYDPAVLSDEGARFLFDLYRSTLATFTENPKLDLSGHAFPATEAVVHGPELSPRFRSLVPQGIHELFADIAAETPDAIALQSSDGTVTYSQLNAQANQFARHLRKRGIEPGSRIAIATSRSPRWVALALGTLRAGGILHPLPPGSKGLPKDAKLLVVDEAAPEHESGTQVLDLSKDLPAIQSEKTRGIQTESDPRTPAAEWLCDGTMRTFSHEHLVTAYQSTAALLGLAPGERLLQFAPSGSPTAIEEMFAALLSGATLLLRADDRWATRTAFQEFVEEHDITTLSIPGPFCSQWLHYLAELSLPVPSSVRMVAVTGEALPPAALAAWAQGSGGQAQLATRIPCAMAAGVSLVSGATPAYFLPAPGARARIVDRRNLPVPFGLVGSVQLATATSEFQTLPLDAFLSASDGVLPRDVRISETSLAGTAKAIRDAAGAHAAVFDAHAELRTIGDRDEWCLWIVSRQSDHGEPHDFREWLAARLPDPPRRIRALPRFPLATDGTIDTTALDNLIPDDAVVIPARRGSEEEERLRQALSRALGGRSIDLDETVTDGQRRPEVAERLHEAVSRVEPRLEPGDFASGFSVRSLLRIARGRAATPDSTWSPITPLRAAGNRPPIVFVHDLEGSARVFELLAAHLDDDQPCFALTARGLADAQSCHRSISEMTAAYMDALQRFDATGSYRLVGFGFGGLLAYEIARQLQGAGVQVPLVVLLATKPPGTRILSGGWKRSLQGLFGKKPAAEPSARQRRLRESPVYQANEQAAQEYAPQPAPGLPLHVFVPEHEFDAFASVEAAWRKLCEGARFYQVPCGPSEMLEEPAVEAVAGALAALSASGKVDTDE